MYDMDGIWERRPGQGQPRSANLKSKQLLLFGFVSPTCKTEPSQQPK